MPNNPGAQNAFPGPLGQDGLQAISGACTDQDILNVFTGNLMKVVSLVSVPTIGLPLEFTLYYNVQDTVSGPVGNLWRHNYQMNLSFNTTPPTHVTFTANTGRQYGFTLSGGNWVPDGSSYFFSGTLTNPSPNWQITFPDNTAYVFNGSGLPITLKDPHGNSTTLAYSGSPSQLATVTEPTGRSLTLGYNPGNTLLTSVTDPNSNQWTLSYDTTNNNLTGLSGPEGCTTSYGYATPSNHQLTTRTDPRGYSYTYSYDTHTPPRLSTVKDAETPSHTISYAYDTVSEQVGTSSQTFNRTRLTDARAKVWDYRFDPNGCLWSVTDPLGHYRRYAYSNNQNLLFETAPFARVKITTTGFVAYDNPNNMFRRWAYDSTGNMLYQVDGSGMVTQFQYDTSRRITSLYPGRAHYAVQGNWVGQFGADGYVLCAYNSNNTDLASLPSYISSVSAGTATKANYNLSSQGGNIVDPRMPQTPSGPGRWSGTWGLTSPNSSFTVTVQPSQSKTFNLSLYASFIDGNPLVTNQPAIYNEHNGRSQQYTVTDMNGTQTFLIYNTAPGAWVTFPVKGDATHAVTVVVAPGPSNPDARISMVAFDPYDSHQTTYTYNSTSDLLTATDGLGNQTVMTYNADGTMATLTDANSHQTVFSYLDTSKNLTKIHDATGQDWLFTYDSNGNVLTAKDPNLHVWTYTWDGQNRMKTVSDPLSNVTSLAYDNGGNLSSVTDPNGNVTNFQYTPTNRLSKVVDPLGNSTLFSYDQSGNLLSVTDALARVTQFQWDNAERLTQVTQADGTKVVSAYDGLDRLRALTTPNGTQSTLTSINVSGAANKLRNPGAEGVDPTTATAAQFWTASPVSASNVRDTTVFHSGSASLKLAVTAGTPYWTQANVSLPAGATAMMNLWGRPDGGANAISVSNAAYLQQFDGTAAATTSGSTSLPASSTAWLQTPWFQFVVPGDAQFTRYTTTEIRTNATASGTPTAWFDDYQLFVLSVAMRYDGEGRFAHLQAPDGASASVQRDRYGQVLQATDPRGKMTFLAYDSLGRVLKATDPLGNVTQYQWDAVGNLSAFIDPNGNSTQYAYDQMNRLKTITYPDTTTEQFSYDVAGRLQTFTNNRSQQRTFAYDNSNRLTSVTYPGTPATTVAFTYDKASNVLSRTERNADAFTFSYDANNRLLDAVLTPGAGSSSQLWVTHNVYDAVGNRLELDLSTSSAGPFYDVAHYDVDRYSSATPHWTVPAGGIDSMDRLLKYQDRLSNQTSFQYDVEGRRTAISFPNGSPNVATAAAYDVVGKLLSLNTTAPASSMNLGYGYDAAANRIAMTQVGTSDNDTWDYAVDDAGRLVQADLNRFTERTLAAFQGGTFSQTLVDPTSAAVGLLPFADGFAGNLLYTERWRMAYGTTDAIGLSVRQNGKLMVAFPRGYTNRQTSVGTPAVQDAYGTTGSLVWVGAEHRTQLSGDFDVQVSFTDFWSAGANATQQLCLAASDARLESAVPSPSNQVVVARDGWANYATNIWSAGVHQVNNVTGTADISGKLRITRSGTTVTAYYWNNGTSAWVSSGTYASFTTGTLYIALLYQVQNSTVHGSYQTFQSNVAASAYPASGTYTSLVYDAGQSVAWSTLSWTATVPAGTTLKFQVATSNSASGPWTYVGPDGTSATFFTTSGTAFTTPPSARYARYQATLSGNGTATPTFTRVDLTYAGTNAAAEYFYSYDAAGNMTQKVVEVQGQTTSTELRNSASWPAADQINNLNQIKRNDITTTGTVTWRYTWDASGNMATKTDGTNNWTYTWDEDNRLVSVAYVGSPANWTVSYTYDSLGRMLTRTDSSGTTKFVWDDMDVVAEFDPAGNETRYYIPDGTLLSFERAGTVYQVHYDALGSVRLITDGSGSTAAHYEYDAWGNLLSSSSDLSGGFFYRFVGALGVRYDAATGLYYMRQRWYDPGLARFVSRDPLRRVNRYLYVENNPTTYIDPRGLHKVVIGFGAPHGEGDVGVIPITEKEGNIFKSQGYDTYAQTDRPLTLSQGQSYLSTTTGLLWISAHAGGVGVDLAGGTLVLKNYKGPLAPNILAISGCNSYNYAKTISTRPGQAILSFSTDVPLTAEQNDRDFIMNELAQGKTIGQAVQDLQSQFPGGAAAGIRITGDPNARI